MTEALWSWSAVDLAAAIRNRQVSCREAVESVLDRIQRMNPRFKALTHVLADEALAAADAADRAVAESKALGSLHGVPVTTKINTDQAGCTTTNGLVSLRDNMASTDSPTIAALKAAGAIVVGRSNAPAFSLRWFTDNDLHGRTLNPWDSGITPGGSSGGAAVAVATGMGQIAHGNDIGGSIRYPAYACGVVGLRPSVGRVAAFNPMATAERGISSQLMGVQGPLAGTVADCRVALHAMARPDAHDPLWVPAPLEGPSPEGPIRVALFRCSDVYLPEPAVAKALDQAAHALVEAGYEVEEAVPPHFQEAADLWRSLLYDDLRRGGLAAIQAQGDDALRNGMGLLYAGMGELDRDAYLNALARRFAIARKWSLFLSHYPVLLMPVSWCQPFPIGKDTASSESVEQMVWAQSPLLTTAMLGLPGLSVPTGVAGGQATGVQIVAARFREDLCLRAGEAIERGCMSPIPRLQQLLNEA